MTRARALLVFLLLPISGLGAELLSIEVDYERGTYTLNSKVWFAATIEQVYEVFHSWDYSAEFSSTIVEARDVAPDELGRAQFYVRNRACILFFCRSFERHGYVEFELNQRLRAFADPDSSDFYLSDERWQFVERDGGTVVTYDWQMRPKFWIPPVIGPYLIKRKLQRDGGRAIDRIEAIAQRVGDD